MFVLSQFPFKLLLEWVVILRNPSAQLKSAHRHDKSLAGDWQVIDIGIGWAYVAKFQFTGGVRRVDIPFSWARNAHERAFAEPEMPSLLATCDDGEIPGGSTEQQIAHMEMRSKFELEKYVELLHDLTPKSHFVKLSDVNELTGKTVTGQESDSIAGLKREIDRVIREDLGGKAFVRLGSRSPKDAVDKPGTVRERVLAVLRNEPKLRRAFEVVSTKKGAPVEVAANDLLRMLRKAFFAAACVSNAEEAFEMLACSSRTISDIKRSMKVGMPVVLCLRTFELWNHEYEIRCFVNENGQLLAMSQYFADIYLPSFQAQQEGLKQTIIQFFQETYALLDLHRHMGAHIVDLAVDLDSGKVVIIELNPFSRTTGSCLFEWDEIDKLDGTNEPVIRGVQSIPDGAAVRLMVWRDLVKIVYEEKIETKKPCVIQ